MDFDMLNSNPEAQLELMNAMLQLEQLTAMSDHSMVVPATPPSPCVSQAHPPRHFISSAPPHSSAGGGTNVAGGYSHLPESAGAASSYVGGGGGSRRWEQHAAAQPTAAVGYAGAAGSAAMREMIFRIAALQPVNIDPETVRPPKRRNVRISTDPQSVAARMRRERISERIRVLQRLVPGGTKMDTASMLDEAIHYVKFLKTQVQSLERAAAANNNNNGHRRSASPGGNSGAGAGAAASYQGLPGPW